MTKETVETNVGGYFWAFNRRCEVTTIGSFGGVFHYGFRTVDNGDFISGWIPADFIKGTEFTK